VKATGCPTDTDPSMDNNFEVRVAHIASAEVVSPWATPLLRRDDERQRRRR